MSAGKYMDRAFATIAPSFSASAPELRIVAEKVAALCAEIEAETREECAKEIADRADGLRRRAIKTREKWCGPEMEPEDRRVNYEDARTDEITARFYDQCAAAIRTGKP